MISALLQSPLTKTGFGAAGTQLLLPATKLDDSGLLLMRGWRLALCWQGSYGLRRFGRWC